jgi:hypothetical protein
MLSRVSREIPFLWRRPFIFSQRGLTANQSQISNFRFQTAPRKLVQSCKHFRYYTF